MALRLTARRLIWLRRRVLAWVRMPLPAADDFLLLAAEAARALLLLEEPWSLLPLPFRALHGVRTVMTVLFAATKYRQQQTGIRGGDIVKRC